MLLQVTLLCPTSLIILPFQLIFNILLYTTVNTKLTDLFPYSLQFPVHIHTLQISVFNNLFLFVQPILFAEKRCIILLHVIFAWTILLLISFPPLSSFVILLHKQPDFSQYGSDSPHLPTLIIHLLFSFLFLLFTKTIYRSPA